MSNPKFLYGAAVQGIQSFIFQTSKLREIVGASELVEKICTSFFHERAPNFRNDLSIIGTAGNIKYLFDSKSDCSYIVKNFPKAVMEFAPGITISQAIVEIIGELRVEDINELEDKLKMQRNKQIAPLDYGYLITERSRRTGLPAVGFINDEAVDWGTKAKLDMFMESSTLAEKIKIDKGNRLPYDFEEMASASEKSWLAVIHADGNGLGKVLQQLGRQLSGKSEHEVINAYKEFSEKLNECTINAADIAIRNALYPNRTKGVHGKKDLLPFRPIVLGGDDLTLVIKSEYAFNFAEEFLVNFEKETERNMHGIFAAFETGITRLTACAGIAYIKSSYPFHYGYELAEQLCTEAKRIAKEGDKKEVPSCLMFHKVQSSFVSTYKGIVLQELTCSDQFSFCYGPYYLNKGDGVTVDWLRQKARLLDNDGAPAAQLRRWLTERYHNKHQAAMLMERTIHILEMDPGRKKYIDQLSLRDAVRVGQSDKKSPYYDIVSLASLLK